MSTTALYYPNITIVTPRRAGQSQDSDRTDLKLLTTAVLLWDNLEVIVPDGGFRPYPIIGEGQHDKEGVINEAFEMVVTPRVLLDEEKSRLHNELKKLINRGVPEQLRFRPQIDNYEMYPEKLTPESWELLREAGLISDGRNGYYGLQRDFGLIVMGLAADICAGGARRKVTNYEGAHEAYSRLLAVQSGATLDFEPDLERAYAILASISLKSVDTRGFPLDKLVALRRREMEDGLLPPLRRNYRAAVDRYVERIKNEAQSAGDVDLIEHEFANEIRDDFRHLEERLKLEAGGIVLCTGISVLTSIASQHWIAAAGLLIPGLPLYQLRRNQVLQEHQTAWLYAA